MEKYTVSGSPLSVGSGELLGLSAAQLATRAHNVEVLAAADKKGITKVKAIANLVFKEREEVYLDRVPKGNGVPAAEAPAKGKGKAGAADKVDADAIRAEGIKAGRAEMLAEIEARNAVYDVADKAEAAVSEAEAALAAEADAEKRKPLEAALETAKAALETAEQAVADLPKLVA